MTTIRDADACPSGAGTTMDCAWGRDLDLLRVLDALSCIVMVDLGRKRLVVFSCYPFHGPAP